MPTAAIGAAKRDAEEEEEGRCHDAIHALDGSAMNRCRGAALPHEQPPRRRTRGHGGAQPVAHRHDE
jgi:hypothetical protein